MLVTFILPPSLSLLSATLLLSGPFLFAEPTQGTRAEPLLPEENGLLFVPLAGDSSVSTIILCGREIILECGSSCARAHPPAQL